MWYGTTVLGWSTKFKRSSRTNITKSNHFAAPIAAIAVLPYNPELLEAHGIFQNANCNAVIIVKSCVSSNIAKASNPRLPFMRVPARCRSNAHAAIPWLHGLRPTASLPVLDAGQLILLPVPAQSVPHFTESLLFLFTSHVFPPYLFFGFASSLLVADRIGEFSCRR
jgi:hypothetical protein